MHSSTLEPSSIHLQPFFESLERQLTSKESMKKDLQSLQEAFVTVENLLETIRCSPEWDPEILLNTCRLWMNFLLKHCKDGESKDLFNRSLLEEIFTQFNEIHHKQANVYFYPLLDALFHHQNHEDCRNLCIEYLIILGLFEEIKNKNHFSLDQCCPLTHYYTKAFLLALPNSLHLPKLRELASGLMLRIMLNSFENPIATLLADDLCTSSSSLDKIELYMNRIRTLKELMAPSDLIILCEMLQEWLRRHKIPEGLQKRKAVLLVSLQEQINFMRLEHPPSSSFIEKAQTHLQTFRKEFCTAFESLTSHISSIPDIEKIYSFQKEIFEKFQNYFKISLWNADLGGFFQPFCSDFDFRVIGSVGRKEFSPFSDLEGFILIKDLQQRNVLVSYVHILKLMMISLGETPSQDIPGLKYFSSQKGLFLDPNPDDDCDLKIGNAERISRLQKPLEDETHYALEQYTLLRSTSLVCSPEDPIQNLYEEYTRLANLYSSNKEPLTKRRALQFFHRLVEERIKTGAPTNTLHVNLKKDYIAPLYFAIHHLGIYFHIQKTNTLEIIDELEKAEFMDYDSAQLMKEAVAALYVMRTRLHFAYNKFCDDAIAENAPSNLQLKPLLVSERFWLKRIDQLVLPPLMEALKDDNPLASINLFSQFNRNSLEIHEKCDKVISLIPSFREYVSYLMDKNHYEKLINLYYFLSRKEILEPLRGEIFSAIEEKTRKFSDKTIEILPELASLSLVPHYETGFRYSYVQQYQKLKEILFDLTTSSPSTSPDGIQLSLVFATWNDVLIPPPLGNEIPNPIYLTRYLKPEYFQHFLDSEALCKKITTQTQPALWLKRQYPRSLHRVIELKHSSGEGLHFKERPTHATLEFAIVSLIYRLFGGGVTPSLLTKLIIDLPNATSYSTALEVSISQKGTLLSDLIKNPSFSDILSIHPKQVTEQLLAHVLLLPSDAHGSNIMHTPQGELISLDLEASFVPICMNNSREIAFVSELFCHDIIPNLDEEALKDFQRIQAYELLSAWLHEIKYVSEGWSHLFKEEASWLLKPLCDPQDICHPKRDSRCVVKASFPPGTLARLYLQIIHLQGFFKKEKQPLTPLRLLEQMITCWDKKPSTKLGEYLAKKYQQSRTKHGLFTRPPKERLGAVTGRFTLTSQSASFTLAQSFGKMLSLEEIEKQSISPSEAIQELEMMDCFYAQGVHLIHTDETVSIEVEKNHTLTLKKQKIILNLLLKSQRIVHLSLPNFSALDDDMLTALLKNNGSHLKTVNLRGCSNISLQPLLNQVSLLIKLEELHFAGQHLSDFTTQNMFGIRQSILFPQLKRITIQNCSGINLISLNAPFLKYIDVENIINLELTTPSCLEYIKISANKLNLVSLLHSVQKAPHLKTITLKNIRKYEGLFEFLEAITETSIDLKMAPVQFGLEELKAEKLGLNHSTFKEKHKEYLKKYNFFIELNLSGDELTASDFSSVATLMQKYYVSKLSLINNGPKNNEKIIKAHRGWRTIAKALSQSHLTHLIVGVNKISDLDIVELADALPRSPITHVEFYYNDINTTSFELIKKTVQNMPQMTSSRLEPLANKRVVIIKPGSYFEDTQRFKKNYIVPEDMTIGQLVGQIRQRNAVYSGQSIFLEDEKKRCFPQQWHISQITKNNFIYLIIIKTENTFD